MIQVEGLTKRYQRVHGRGEVNYRAEPGLVTDFLGPNGADKSRTMRMMIGLAPPTSGSATVLRVPYGQIPNLGCCSTQQRSTTAAPAARFRPSARC